MYVEQLERETEPEPMEHITAEGYLALRHFALVHLGDGIEPANQRTLWVNNGLPMNLMTKYEEATPATHQRVS
jgi:hypothetical protein